MYKSESSMQCSLTYLQDGTQYTSHEYKRNPCRMTGSPLRACTSLRHKNAEKRSQTPEVRGRARRNYTI